MQIVGLIHIRRLAKPPGSVVFQQFGIEIFIPQKCTSFTLALLGIAVPAFVLVDEFGNFGFVMAGHMRDVAMLIVN